VYSCVTSDSHIVFVRPRRTPSDIYTNPCANIFYHIRLPTMYLFPIRICLEGSVSDTWQLCARVMVFGEKKQINIRNSVSKLNFVDIVTQAPVLEVRSPFSTAAERKSRRRRRKREIHLWERIFHRVTNKAGKSHRITGYKCSWEIWPDNWNPVIRHDFPAAFVERWKMRSHNTPAVVVLGGES
jgi:hypothetical protein